MIYNGEPKLIANYIYFYHLDKFLILPLYPDNVTDNTRATFGSTTALSRTAPVFTYSNSGPRDVNVTFDLHRDMMNDVNKDLSQDLTTSGVRIDFNTVPGFEKVDKTIKPVDYVDLLVNYLQAISLPNYNIYNNKSKSVDPPMIALRLGKQIFIKGVVGSGVQVTYKKPIMPDGKYALVTIGFTISEVEPYDAKTVVEVGSFRTAAAGFDIDLVGTQFKSNWNGKSAGDAIFTRDNSTWVNTPQTSNTPKIPSTFTGHGGIGTFVGAVLGGPAGAITGHAVDEVAGIIIRNSIQNGQSSQSSSTIPVSNKPWINP